MREDAILWLVIGDSYAGGNTGNQSNVGQRYGKGRQDNGHIFRKDQIEGIKPKDMMGIPWRLALALQAKGWYLRSEITWCKTCPMPESVTDRPTSATEKIFLLTKSKKYFYYPKGVTVAAHDPEDYARRIRHRAQEGQKSNPTEERNGLRVRDNWHGGGRQNPENGDQHFGEGRGNYGLRGLARGSVPHPGHETEGGQSRHGNMLEDAAPRGGGANLRNFWLLGPEPFLGGHFAAYPSEIPRRCILLGSKPGDVVLDPFGGSGTTGMVALELGRKAVLCELNPEYVKLAEQRCRVTPGLPLA